jgi:hypothetical protein
MDNGSVKGGSQAEGYTRALQEKCRRLKDAKRFPDVPPLR